MSPGVPRLDGTRICLDGAARNRLLAMALCAEIEMFSTGEPRDEAALRAQVADIADRKRRLCPDDPRQIVRVDVVPRGRNIEVVAMSA